MDFYYKRKIKTLDQIKEISKKFREDGKIVSTINGSFDLLHAGHIYMIEQAKKQGDILILGLNSDKSYKEYKDNRGPLVNEGSRALLLASLANVDFVVLFDDPVPLNFLKAVHPNIHCNGAEYGKECVESKLLRKMGAKLFIIPELEFNDGRKFSTSDLISRIVERFSGSKNKAIFLDLSFVKNGSEEEVIDILKYFKNNHYKIIIISNKSNQIKTDLAYKRFFDKIYLCPHKIKGVCDCKKPGFALFQKAKKENNLDMKKCWTIGDDINDCIAGKKAGTITIYIGWRKSKSMDYVVEKLSKIKKIIKKDEARKK